MTERADRIQHLLKDPDLQQAFQDLRDALLNAFTTCSTKDVETMVDIRKRLNLLDQVESLLYQAIEDGKLEDFRAVQDEKPSVLGDLIAWKRKHQ